MNSNSIYILTLIFIFLFSACKKQDATKVENKDTTAVVKKEEVKETKIESNSKIAKLKFKDFVFGDAEHFMFEDEKGAEVQFGFCKDKSIEFGIEVKPNDTNQGFGPNPKLIGKWFEISYTTEKRPLYQDGPEGDVDVILTAKEVK